MRIKLAKDMVHIRKNSRIVQAADEVRIRVKEASAEEEKLVLYIRR